MPKYAVFCQPRGKNRAIDPPCLDPLDFGIGDEPWPGELLRRGRVGLFATLEEALTALRTIRSGKDSEFTKSHEFIVLECVER